MSNSVRALFYEEKNIGNLMKKYADYFLLSRSKRHYTWRIELDGQEHLVDFFDSLLSGKKKVVVDGITRFEKQL